jgi:prevent-host-death family protein
MAGIKVFVMEVGAIDLDQRLVQFLGPLRLSIHRDAAMEISVTDAKGQLTELVRRAEAGDDVILTRHGHPAVRLVPITREVDARTRRALLEEVRAAGMRKVSSGTDAARSQDFLYDVNGLPK